MCEFVCVVCLKANVLGCLNSPVGLWDIAGSLRPASLTFNLQVL